MFPVPPALPALPAHPALPEHYAHPALPISLCPASRMLHKDPRQRATIRELLMHPWLACASGSDSTGGTADHAAAAKPRYVPDTVVSRLHRFTTMGHFKKEARRVVSSFLPQEEVRASRQGRRGDHRVELSTPCMPSWVLRRAPYVASAKRGPLWRR